MRGSLNATLFDGLPGYIGRTYLIVALNVSMTVYGVQIQHLVHQLRDAVAIFHNLLGDVLQLVAVNLNIGRGQHLTES